MRSDSSIGSEDDLEREKEFDECFELLSRYKTVFFPCLFSWKTGSLKTRCVYLIFSFKESSAIYPRDSN